MTRVLCLKITHDASVAVFESNRLLFATEMEKIDNRPRYTAMEKLAWIDQTLQMSGFSTEDIDVVLIDGWKGGLIKKPFEIDVAPYHEYDHDSKGAVWPGGERFSRFTTKNNLKAFINKEVYLSAYHMSNHIYSAIMTSSWASGKSYVLSWDGGQPPRVHEYNHDLDELCFVGELLPFYGIIYSIMGLYFGPYSDRPKVKPDGSLSFGDYDIPGKLMSYIALGVDDREVFEKALQIAIDVEGRHKLDYSYHQNGEIEHEFCQRVKDIQQGKSDATMLLAIHNVLGALLERRLSSRVPFGSRLAFVGGSALNIKWNSLLRKSGHFSEIWVPPFPNDSGSAIGVGCNYLARKGYKQIVWDVYSGLNPIPRGSHPDFKAEIASPKAVAEEIARGKLIVVISGKAELGPRALGNRSILADPRTIKSKDRLNNLKNRESFRPVAPICLESFSSSLMFPGGKDPYMLFEHTVISDDIPAVTHIDGSARLQTLRGDENTVTCEILTEFHNLTGVPLLCNTSANLNGSGFFSSVYDACEWCKDKDGILVYDGTNLYSKKEST